MMNDECGMKNEERLEVRYLSAGERVARLTQSLLAKAFRGELVEQDAGDESKKSQRKLLKMEISNAKKT